MATLLCALMTLLAVPAAAQIAPQPRRVAMTLVPESAAPAAGSRVTLAFAARPDAGWHAYWQNPGDAGMPATATWTLPSGLKAGELRYPVPERLLIAGLMNYVYERPFALLVELDVPAGLSAGTRLPVSVKLDYLVCTTEICVPESQTLTTALTVGDGAIAPATRARFDAWRQALPKPLGATATWQAAGGTFRLALPYPGDQPGRDAYFYPAAGGAIDYAAPQRATRDGDRLVIETKAAATPASGDIAGVLAVDGRGFEVRARPGVVPAATGRNTAEAGDMTLAWALLGAIVGGLLLNIMPCVFPILSLKALSLAKSGADAATARREALAYTAGVVLVCLALGGVLLALRAGGAAAGWAFQLQDPRVIALLLLLTVAIALNLAGLFELPTPRVASRAGTSGAFATGALAAFVATPCTGPFMGAALGAALVLPAAAALAVFAGLGLGIALPFLAIGFVPALRRRLPKPGAWMVTFRHVLALPMFATALALAWVLGRQAGVNGLTLMLGAALIAGCGLWWAGRRQAAGRSAWIAAPALVAALVAAVLVQPAPTEAKAVAGGERFTEARLAALQAEGRPVFAYFTADWCLTCKVNEKAAIETDTTNDAFRRGNVAVLVGDWTDGDPALGRFIQRHNRAGVPLYLWYKKGMREPQVLPQLLTPAMLADLSKGA